MTAVCDHTPDSELRGHLEIWRSDEGWNVVAFVRPELHPEVVIECGSLDPALEVAAEQLTSAVKEMDDVLEGRSL